jgi:hypothetical protein
MAKTHYTENSNSNVSADTDTERFIRWQKLAIDQLGYTLNFVLTLTIASLGYIFSLFQSRHARSALVVGFTHTARNRGCVGSRLHHQSAA